MSETGFDFGATTPEERAWIKADVRSWPSPCDSSSSRANSTPDQGLMGMDDAAAYWSSDDEDGMRHSIKRALRNYRVDAARC
jgi:hypothetical protein